MKVPAFEPKPNESHAQRSLREAAEAELNSGSPWVQEAVAKLLGYDTQKMTDDLKHLATTGEVTGEWVNVTDDFKAYCDEEHTFLAQAVTGFAVAPARMGGSGNIVGVAVGVRSEKWFNHDGISEADANFVQGFADAKGREFGWLDGVPLDAEASFLPLDGTGPTMLDPSLKEFLRGLRNRRRTKGQGLSSEKEADRKEVDDDNDAPPGTG